jgi:hypothetical protein
MPWNKKMLDEVLRFHLNDRSSIHDTQHTRKTYGVLQQGRSLTHQYGQTMKLQYIGTNSSHINLFNQLGFWVSL